MMCNLERGRWAEAIWVGSEARNYCYTRLNGDLFEVIDPSGNWREFLTESEFLRFVKLMLDNEQPSYLDEEDQRLASLTAMKTRN